MKNKKIAFIFKEILWLIAIIGISAAIEFALIEILDLHPVLNIKIQGLIGLMILGYGIRMSFRIWKSFHSSKEPESNGQEAVE